MATWIRSNVTRPLLVGPDEESGQWVADVARRTEARSVMLRKMHKGDREVDVSVPDVEHWRTHTPVLVDDIVSTSRTMIETIDHLRRAGLDKPVCIAVHAVFSGNAAQVLTAAGGAAS
ncbi:phosphoribosyltransferase family protein [Variovorax sp. HW608]|uniref:phosphoribosyltransferase family protein n=1 Tax=Variovorax sp. HW608 TaxID=1034889 RepID=UPI001E4AC6AA|nr:phosphoribosyltransferase family protein [Variovorax sp. HW608]